MNSHYTTFGFILRISVVISYYSLVLPHLYNTVFGWQSAWLWIRRQQSTQSHHVTPALSQCVLFFSGLNNLLKLDFIFSGLNNLFKLDFVESALQAQNDAFHNLLTGAVRHWMGEDCWGDWMVDRAHSSRTPDINAFTHSQQPLPKKVMDKCSMITTKLRLSKIVTPFPVVEEHWDPNAVITMADDRCSNCRVSRAGVTKPKLQEHSRWRTVVTVRPKALERGESLLNNWQESYTFNPYIFFVPSVWLLQKWIWYFFTFSKIGHVRFRLANKAHRPFFWVDRSSAAGLNAAETLVEEVWEEERRSGVETEKNRDKSNNCDSYVTCVDVRCF